MGQVFAGRYELVDLLGHGGGGDVWRAWDHREGFYCATKLMRQSDSAGLLRFVRESTTRIEHPHVLAPTGWVGEDAHVLIAMPIVTGGSVADLVADHGALPAPWVHTLIRQLLSALEAVHDAGLVHRDVKPANLLLDATGSQQPLLRLADFGIAVSRDDPRLTSARDVLHTPGYTAPEVIEGADPDPSHDLFAAGMVMTEIMTGRGPDREAVRSPDPADGHLERVCARLVARDPLVRYQRAAQARIELESPHAPWTSGDVEVFDHVPPLPDGWTTHGPVREPTPDSPRAFPPAARTPSRWASILKDRQVAAAAVMAVAGAGLLLAAALLF